MKKTKIIHSKIYFYLFTALSFVIPVNERAVVLIIFLLGLNWLVSGDFLQFGRVLNDRRRLAILLFAFIYLGYLAGMAYSDNKMEGWFVLEKKMSLFVFPFIFSTIDYSVFPRKKILSLFYAFIIGCFVSTIILLVKSVVRYYDTGAVSEFFYVDLASNFHPSYLSMYLTFAILLLFMIPFCDERIRSRHYHLLCYGLIIYFFLFTMMLSSKAGILTMIVLIISYITLVFFYYRKPVKAGIIFLLLIGGIIFCFAFFSITAGRFIAAKETLTEKESLDIENRETTATRIYIWKSSYEIIKRNFWLGVGTGDVSESLMHEYEEAGNIHAFEQRFNTHNQYLQSFVALGLAGFLITLAYIVAPLVYSVRNRNILFVLFLMLTGLHFLFESMLERQSGIVFYAFFIVFFLFIEKELRS